jgi:hypothetical protein
MCTFVFEGVVYGVDIITIVFADDQLEIMADVIVPDTLEQVQQLLTNEPTMTSLCPFIARGVSVQTTIYPLSLRSP